MTVKHRWYSVYLFLLLLPLVGLGCEQQDVSLEMKQELRDRVQAVDGPHADEIRRFYSERNYMPVWVGPDALTALATDFLRQVCKCGREGLSITTYEIPAVEKALRQAYLQDIESDSLRGRQMAALEVELSHLFFKYADDLLNGRVDPEAVNGQWHLGKRSSPIVPVLREIIAQQDIGVLQQRVNDQVGYQALRRAFNRYRHVEESGGWPRVPAGAPLAIDSTGPRVVALKRRLRIVGDLPPSAPDDSTFHEVLKEAVIRFQQRHGLEADGVVREEEFQALNVPAERRVQQLGANLERRRWMPPRLNELRITVNIPDYNLYAYRSGVKTLEMPVIVGKKLNQTPIFADTLRYIVFRPYWNVPASISIQEILPHLTEESDYLVSNSYEVVNADGQVVPYDRIQSMDKERLRAKLRNYQLLIREKPGPRNALGLIKFMFPNAYAIYLHDTPAKYLFSRQELTFSHGCIRLKRPVDLAEFVLSDAWSRQRIIEAMHSGEKANQVSVEQPLPVYILYRTAWVDASGRINFRDDIYNHDQALWRAIDGNWTEAHTQICASLSHLLDQLE